MTDEILDIRRRAGLTEAWGPEDDMNDIPDPQEEFRERIYDYEKLVEKKTLLICKKLDMSMDTHVMVDVNPQNRTIEITIYPEDTEITLGLLAELSKTGLLTLETRVVATSHNGIGLYIETNRPLTAQEITALQYPAQLG